MTEIPDRQYGGNDPELRLAIMICVKNLQLEHCQSWDDVWWVLSQNFHPSLKHLPPPPEFISASTLREPDFASWGGTF